MASTNDIQHIRCSHCTYKGPLHTFPLKKNLSGRVKTCQKCTSYSDKAGKDARARKSGNKENSSPQPSSNDVQDSENSTVKDTSLTILGGHHATLPLHDVFHAISAHKESTFSLDYVAVLNAEELEELEDEAGDSLGAWAHAIARRVQAACGWRFK